MSLAWSRNKASTARVEQFPSRLRITPGGEPAVLANSAWSSSRVRMWKPPSLAQVLT